MKDKIVKEWFTRAQRDYEVAKLVFESESYYDEIIFLLHQAVEKYLKGYLIFQGWGLKKIHDIYILLDEAIRYNNSFDVFLDFGKKLTVAQKNYIKFVGIMIDKQYESPLKDVVSSTLLGTQEFIGFIKDKYLSGKNDDKDLPALKTLKREISIDNISKEVDKVVKEDKKLSRNIKIYLCQRLTGKRLDDIGAHFAIGGSGVCQASRRIVEKFKKNKALMKTVKKMEDKLSIMKV